MASWGEKPWSQCHTSCRMIMSEICAHLMIETHMHQPVCSSLVKNVGFHSPTPLVIFSGSILKGMSINAHYANLQWYFPQVEKQAFQRAWKYHMAWWNCSLINLLPVETVTILFFNFYTLFCSPGKLFGDLLLQFSRSVFSFIGSISICSFRGTGMHGRMQ